MLSRPTATSVDDAVGVFPELRKRLNQRAGTLSGGQQQMLALAQALVSRPTYLLADELSLGLAPVVVARLVEAVRAIAAAGTGVLLIEQFTTIAVDWRPTRLDGTRSTSGQARAAELRDNPELVRQAYLAGDFHLDR